MIRVLDTVPFFIKEGGDTVGTILEREWTALLKKEEKILFSAERKKDALFDKKIGELTEKVERKIPEKVSTALNDAFYKAFLILPAFFQNSTLLKKSSKTASEYTDGN